MTTYSLTLGLSIVNLQFFRPRNYRSITCFYWVKCMKTKSTQNVQLSLDKEGIHNKVLECFAITLMYFRRKSSIKFFHFGIIFKMLHFHEQRFCSYNQYSFNLNSCVEFNMFVHFFSWLAPDGFFGNQYWVNYVCFDPFVLTR